MHRYVVLGHWTFAALPRDARELALGVAAFRLRPSPTQRAAFFFYFFSEPCLFSPPVLGPPSLLIHFLFPLLLLPSLTLTPLNQSPLFSFHSGPSGLSEGDRVPTKLQERATDFLPQFEKFRYLFPRCQLAWLSWQQQSSTTVVQDRHSKNHSIEKNIVLKKSWN